MGLSLWSLASAYQAPEILKSEGSSGLKSPRCFLSPVRTFHGHWLPATLAMLPAYLTQDLSHTSALTSYHTLLIKLLTMQSLLSS